MSKNALVAILLAGGVTLGCGLMFLCASAAATERSPIRLALAVLLVVVGGGAAAWAGLNWRRLSDVEPHRLAERIVEWVHLQNKFETTVAEAVAGLAAPATQVQQALHVLMAQGEVVLDQRQDRRVYVFPGLKESKVERRCPYCGVQFPVKQAIMQCPNCGGTVELKRT